MGDLVFLPGPLLTEDEYDSYYDSDGSDFSTASCCCSDCHDPCEGWTGKPSRWMLGRGGKRTGRCCPGDDGGCSGEESGGYCEKERGCCREACCYEEWHGCRGGRDGRDGRCRGSSGGRGSRSACIQVNNTICYDCPRPSSDRDTCHHQRHSPCKCEKKKPSKRTWWSNKPTQKKPKARRRIKKRVTEYTYDYGDTNRGCRCGDDSDSEYETAEEEMRPRVVRRDRKVREERVRERVVEKPRRRGERRCAPRRVRRKRVRTPASDGESDDSLRCQVSDVDFESETERGDAVAHYKHAVGWPRTPSRVDSDELGERGKGSRSSRDFCKRSRHSI